MALPDSLPLVFMGGPFGPFSVTPFRIRHGSSCAEADITLSVSAATRNQRFRFLQTPAVQPCSSLFLYEDQLSMSCRDCCPGASDVRDVSLDDVLDAQSRVRHNQLSEDPLCVSDNLRC